MAICSSCGHRADVDFKFCPECGAAVVEVAPARGLRKTVTVVFCDLVGSTALGESTDPEALREVLARYFARMKGIVERHGGTVEKFIGDAVMAVFGVPVVHEDDALRACRAALEMRDALPELGIDGRIGVNTGEVVTGTEERLATGDAVNVASRFEQAAAPGEVLIGEATHALVRGAVVAEPVEPLTLKGKSESVRAYRLVSVLDAPERSPFLATAPQPALYVRGDASKPHPREMQARRVWRSSPGAPPRPCCDVCGATGDVAAVDRERLHDGVAGWIVHTIDPHTESDPIAILVQLLVGFGSAVGRTRYIAVEADKHHSNLFAVLVGDTAKARKGTSWGHARRLLCEADPESEPRIMGGLSSGEGLIAQVADSETSETSEERPVALTRS